MFMYDYLCIIKIYFVCNNICIFIILILKYYIFQLISFLFIFFNILLTSVITSQSIKDFLASGDGCVFSKT